MSKKEKKQYKPHPYLISKATVGSDAVVYHNNQKRLESVKHLKFTLGREPQPEEVLKEYIIRGGVYAINGEVKNIIGHDDDTPAIILPE